MPNRSRSHHSLLLVAGIAATTFALLAWSYINGSPVSRIDLLAGELLQPLYAVGGTMIGRVLYWVSFFGGSGLLFIAGIVAGYLAGRRSWAELVLWMTTVVGVIVLNRLLKDAFVLTRPVVGQLDLLEDSSGFPSGHAMIATATYGLLALLIAEHVPRALPRWLLWSALGLLLGLIGFSRVYLGVHYLIDVVAGYVAGVAWLCLCLWLYRQFALPIRVEQVTQTLTRRALVRRLD